jgi:hypothetical protein
VSHAKRRGERRSRRKPSAFYEDAFLSAMSGLLAALIVEQVGGSLPKLPELSEEEEREVTALLERTTGAK